jgi:hypothetical protein
MVKEQSPAVAGCLGSVSKSTTAKPPRQPGWVGDLTPIQDAQEITPEAAPAPVPPAPPVKAPTRPRAKAPAPAPASNHRAESIVLASAIDADSETLPPFVSKLIANAPEAFENGQAAVVAQAVKSLLAEAKPINCVSVGQVLPPEHQNALLGILAPGNAIPISLAETEAESLWRDYSKRQARRLLLEGADHLQAGSATVETIARVVNDGLAGLANTSTTNAIASRIRPLADLQRRIADDESELIRTGFLCRGGGLLLVGPTGVGKSSFAMQLALSFALGRSCFGIEPTRPLRTLVIQAENDDGDVAEMRDGVLAGLQLGPEDREAACRAVHILSEDATTGLEFVAKVVRTAVMDTKPDLLQIDPALAFVGGESNSQKDVGGFLRNGLNPVIHEAGCGLILIHHSNKPPSGTEKATWSGSDLAYLGAGSAEWCNWARCVLALRGVGSNSVFELIGAKRGGRLRWRDAEGQPTYKLTIAHHREPGVICWREADLTEMPSKGGRPKEHSPEKLASLLTHGGLSSKEWQAQARDEHGIKERRFFELKAELMASKRVLQDPTSRLWKRI